ncbi:uncharacterized protein LOC107808707 [Nicotiana tabacum]|uniref:Uncharacterized protein LOC107808707 n=1 Tax=Nicotiana tabacum TaxID=4097 RepID=A0A1S4BIP0_TOBAC|nr:PREDICTED: uncharacterized protein LOC107808707 [Nicotiana tabacum]
MELTWIVGGDFNVILSEEEKIGGLPVYPSEYENFAFCVNSSRLIDLGYKESPFTWWNGRPNAECIFKRLDRILVNLPFQNLFPSIEMEHLIRTGSDHAPLLIICGENTTHLDQLAKEVVDFFQNQFSQEGDPTSYDLLSNVTSMVSMEQNIELCRMPIIEEVKRALFALSGDSESGPDGFTRIFYQECWDIVGENIFNMLQIFYSGAPLPKSVTHTNLVLLPKKVLVSTFSDLRPISLSNFINKIISRVIHDRLEKILPSLISSNQSGFVKRKTIFENILLTQKIIIDIRLRGKPANVVIKLDMAKAYDRTDPLNHLAYVDDIIIFVSADPYSIEKGGGVLDPPHNVLEYLHKTFARFFWSNKEEGRSKHWKKWLNISLPKEEGGLGFRSIFHISKDLFAKLWWKFRTTKSIWSNFMWNKYCKKELPIVVQFRQGSHVWKKMLEVREEVENDILWEMNRGSTDVWHDKWTGLGALYHVVPQYFPINEEFQEVAELRDQDSSGSIIPCRTYKARSALQWR